MHAHRSTTAKTVAAIAAVGLIPFGLAVVSNLPADEPPSTIQAATGISTPAYVPNWVAIQTGATSRITLNGASGQLGAPQTLAPAANCGVNLGPDASQFVTLEGSIGRAFSGSLASYANGSIGVKEKKSGTSCSQVNAVTTESLRLALGDNISTLLGPDAVASSASLDVELKGAVRIQATAYLGTEPQGVYELRSGSLAESTPVPPGVTAFTCNLSPDSGADSNVSDNCRWPISAPSWGAAGDDGVFFDSLNLEALAGSFSLEGGADGAVQPAPLSTPNASILEIATDTLGCNATTRTETGTGDEPTVSVYRLGNSDGSSCALVPYSLANGSGFAQFLKPLDSQPSAQFIWDITGRLSPTAGTTDLPDLKIDYETPESDPPAYVSPVPLGWCPDATYSNGRFAGYTAEQLASNTTFPDQDNYAGKQYACVISRTATSVNGSPDVVEVRELVYVYGDAKTTW